MLNRRNFLRSSFATGLGLVAAGSANANRPVVLESPQSDLAFSKYERILSAARLLRSPRPSALLVPGKTGLSPDPSRASRHHNGTGRRRMGQSKQNAEARLRERLADLGLPAGKLDLILRLIHVWPTTTGHRS